MVGTKLGFGMDQLETWQLLLDIFKRILTCTCLLIQYFSESFFAFILLDSLIAIVQ